MDARVVVDYGLSGEVTWYRGAMNPLLRRIRAGLGLCGVRSPYSLLRLPRSFSVIQEEVGESG